MKSSPVSFPFPRVAVSFSSFLQLLLFCALSDAVHLSSLRHVFDATAFIVPRVFYLSLSLRCDFSSRLPPQQSFLFDHGSLVDDASISNAPLCRHIYSIDYYASPASIG
ncbi:hypothetical protein MAP00_007371 [Monascus purpureus]|nr:hypothetical protein MAP00_007371 [Monascus purpureus]